jgi:hypothetical protein
VLCKLKSKFYARIESSDSSVHNSGHILRLLDPEDGPTMLVLKSITIYQSERPNISVRHYKYMEYVLSAIYYTNISVSSKRTPVLKGNIFISLDIPLQIRYAPSVTYLTDECLVPGRLGRHGSFCK